MSKQFTKKDIRRLSYRWSWNRSLAWNYEKMMTAGYMTTMLPVIDKLYQDDPEGRKKAFETHSVFFNCEPNLTNIILGMDIAIEEEMGAEGLETVAGIKASLMGPFAGIGDTLFTSVLATIFGSIALRPYLMQLGYTQGIKLVTTLSGKLNQITQAASVLGIMVVGSMVASLVKVNFGTLTIMGTEFDLQTKLFDAIMPKFGAVLVVALCYWVLGKIGMKSSRLILMIMALAILCSFLGVLVP